MLDSLAKVTELLTELHHINSPGENIAPWLATVDALAKSARFLAAASARGAHQSFNASAEHRVWHAGLNTIEHHRKSPESLEISVRLA